jgi:hypothetical protein
MKPKHLPRLWCALQGLLPFEACLAAQRAELALPPTETEESVAPLAVPWGRGSLEYCIAETAAAENVGGLESR